MCSTAADWFNRYVTCCVASPRRRSRGDVSSGLTQCQRRCSSVPRSSHRRHHDLDLGGGSVAARLLRSWRSRRRHDEERVKCTDGGNDVMAGRHPVFTISDDVDSKLLSGLEYVCCCERCDSVVGWYLTNVAADVDSSEQSLHSSLRLQNYMVACESGRSRPGKMLSPGSSSNVKDVDISCVSLISSCDIKGVDLLVGHQLKKPTIEDVKLVNELVSCFRPPPNRTIGHIYLAVSATADTSSSSKTTSERRS